MSALHSFEYQNMISSSEASWEGFKYLEPIWYVYLFLFYLAHPYHPPTQISGVLINS